MVWKTIATVIIVVFSVAIAQAVLAGPFLTIQNDLNETGDYSDNGHFDGNSILTSLPLQWFDMGLIAIFGAMAWGSWRVVRRELTRGRL